MRVIGRVGDARPQHGLGDTSARFLALLRSGLRAKQLSRQDNGRPPSDARSAARVDGWFAAGRYDTERRLAADSSRARPRAARRPCARPARAPPLTKRARELRRRHDLVASAASSTLSAIVELGIDHDAEQPVAADREPNSSAFSLREQVTTVPSASIRRNERTVRAERAVRHRPAMRVDRQRAADAEVVVRLRHHRREAERIERRDHVAPARAGAHAMIFRARIGLDHGVAERGREAVARQALPAHRMTCAADRRAGAPSAGGFPQQRAQRRDQRARRSPASTACCARPAPD